MLSILFPKVARLFLIVNSGPRIGLLFGVCFVLASCQYFRAMIGEEPLPPKLTLSSVEVISFNTQKLKLNVGFKIENPNDFDIRFKDLSYRFRIKDKKGKLIANGVKKDEISLIAGTKHGLFIPVEVDAMVLFTEVLTQLSNQKKIDLYYDVNGKFDGPLGYMQVQRSGSWSQGL